jgi:hypothetical protein
MDIIFVYSVPTSALVTLNVKKYRVVVLKLLKSIKSYKYIVSFNMFRFFINHFQGASGTSKKTRCCLKMVYKKPHHVEA